MRFLNDLKLARIDGILRQHFGPETIEISALKDSYRDETMLILGNGPSLADVPNSTLSNFLTFGSNGIFLKFEPTLYITISKTFFPLYKGKISRLNSELKFLPYQFSHEGMGKGENTKYLPNSYPFESITPPHRRVPNPIMFSKNPSAIIYLGGTVIFAQLQLALYMGVKRVLLAGVDHDFGLPSKDPTWITVGQRDHYHFDESYLPEGATVHVDLEASDRAFSLAKKAYDSAGVELWNATESSLLETIPRASLDRFTG